MSSSQFDPKQDMVAQRHLQFDSGVFTPAPPSSPAAYAATKKQLHRPARAAIDAGAATDTDVRASWISEETRGRINGFLESLARGR